MENRELQKKLETYIQNDISERALASRERAEMKKDIEYIKKGMDDILSTIKSDSEKYVTRSEFGPYKVALNITAGLVLTGLVGALLSLVLIQWK